MFGSAATHEAMAHEPRIGLQRCGVQEDTPEVAANLKGALHRTTTCVGQNSGREEPSHISKCEETDRKARSGRVTVYSEVIRAWAGKCDFETLAIGR